MSQSAAKEQYNITDCDSPVVHGYGGDGADVLCATIGPPTPPVEAAPQGSLPLTGFDAALIALVAVLLLVVGFILRKFPRL